MYRSGWVWARELKWIHSNQQTVVYGKEVFLQKPCIHGLFSKKFKNIALYSNMEKVLSEYISCLTKLFCSYKLYTLTPSSQSF